MALTKDALTLLAPYLRKAKVLCFGYPDMLVTPEEASEITGARVRKLSPFGANHKREAPMADTQEVFDALGASVFCVDLLPTRMVEQVVDLNYPQQFDRFNVVIDAGTIEHCANIGQALMTAASAVAPEGVVYHSPPLNMPNHGFYAVSPTLLADFYLQNGWEVKFLRGFSASQPYYMFATPHYDRFKAQDNSALHFLARRTKDAPEELKWPTQHKYLPKENA